MRSLCGIAPSLAAAYLQGEGGGETDPEWHRSPRLYPKSPSPSLPTHSFPLVNRMQFVGSWVPTAASVVSGFALAEPTCCQHPLENGADGAALGLRSETVRPAELGEGRL